MPQYATSTYSQFISLRVTKIISFFIVVWIIQFLATYLTKDQIIEYIAYIGVIISVLSLYSYFSFFLDFPDFNRTRAGSGGWSQPIQRACSVLRNYGTFREPSFLAVWTVPFIPLNFYLARKNNKWYFLSILPILSLILTRSLTGVISVLIACLVILFVYLLKTKKLKLPFYSVYVKNKEGRVSAGKVFSNGKWQRAIQSRDFLRLVGACQDEHCSKKDSTVFATIKKGFQDSIGIVPFN